MDQVFTLACHEFFKEAITYKMLPQGQVIRIGEVDAKLHQWVTYLETKLDLSKPPRVLEAW